MAMVKATILNGRESTSVIEPKNKCLSKMLHPDLLLADDLVYKLFGHIVQNS